jgi:hypothetical protein
MFAGTAANSEVVQERAAAGTCQVTTVEDAGLRSMQVYEGAFNVNMCFNVVMRVSLQAAKFQTAETV